MERETNKYGFEYHHDGSTWIIHVQAYDEDDACERMKKMSRAKCLGQLMASIPAAGGERLHLRIIGMLRKVMTFLGI